MGDSKITISIESHGDSIFSIGNLSTSPSTYKILFGKVLGECRSLRNVVRISLAALALAINENVLVRKFRSSGTLDHNKSRTTGEVCICELRKSECTIAVLKSNLIIADGMYKVKFVAINYRLKRQLTKVRVVKHSITIFECDGKCITAILYTAPSTFKVLFGKICRSFDNVIAIIVSLNACDLVHSKVIALSQAYVKGLLSSKSECASVLVVYNIDSTDVGTNHGVTIIETNVSNIELATLGVDTSTLTVSAKSDYEGVVLSITFISRTGFLAVPSTSKVVIVRSCRLIDSVRVSVVGLITH